MREIDCGDNSCMFAKNKTGMRTNGGCRCLHDLPIPVTSNVSALKFLYPEYLRLQSENAALKEKLGIAVEALRFYEKRDHYGVKWKNNVEPMVSKIEDDYGKLARDTIKKLEGK